MKKYNKLMIALLAGALLTGTTTSCSDFLNEELTTQRNTDYLQTPEGIESLAVGLYYNLRFDFGWEWGFATTNYGTDEFRVGGDGSNAMWNSYDGSFNSMITAVNVNTAMAETLWDNMYTGINTANILLENTASDSYTDPNKNTYMGEAHFLRGFNYLKLVRQYGGVPLKLKSSNTLEREFTRASASDVLQQVIDDLTEAYNLLPATGAMTGKITKYAAAHYLTKAYLTRASEINDSWNGSTKAADCQKALQYADEVIGRHKLASNFSDLWNYTEPNGANENLDEIILAAQFSADKSTWGSYGNQTHLYFLSQYLNLPQMKRDVAGGREYQRLRTTYYMYNVYDMVNDSRFWKSFKTKYAVNNPSGDYYEKGDLSIMYVINRPGDDRFDEAQISDKVVYEKTGKTIPTVFPAYIKGKEEPLYGFLNRFPPLSKFIDGSRQTVSDGIGYRDGILARVADTYLLAAEAKIRLQDYSGALTYINAVRERAAYKEGENRAAYCDGGAAYNEGSLGYGTMGNTISYFPENSYYESNNIDKTTASTSLTVTSKDNLPAADEAIIKQLGYSSDHDRMMCFLLNERSRELSGEFHRWEDLARTKTLVARAKAFNPDAKNNITEHHCLRPIPQKYLDSVQKDGKALTSEEKAQEQNPGY
ncbi:hypothetical protein M2480_001684 [Parabacteroides sp. PFB2-12]|uniref:RagB/SusD family nutrient uptake outer membrane protein n=1 Tax=unclassified Parabacteroides TaxID=2649774 RepID=UPI0024736D6C|nr:MULTISPECIES: RagB/SusD family nutrient uptake outer membrane protein [unclassified Parabacteroides]MDH6342366.1 hypothetical protein [Parabacteroides sp. PM6-13]MDH6390709.1 hypothetical protein [Parabacteroides sp. PFB2-12]